MAKIIIADDHVLFCEALNEYIKRYMVGVDVVFFGNFDEAYEAVRTGDHPDLLILDYNMAGMNDGRGVEIVRDEFPDLSVAIMSGVAEGYQIRKVLDLGVVGYFPKTLSGDKFVAGIKQLLGGDKFIPVSLEGNVIMRAYNADNGGGKASEHDGGFITAVDIHLSAREKEVLCALLDGKSNKEIANIFDIREVTVKMHISNICRKLDVQNRTQAALKARELGFIG